jgi:hypothetical protein
MRYWKLVLPSLLVAIMVFGLVNSVPAQPAEPSAPKISLTPSVVHVTPCSNFFVTVWITDIPGGWEMTEFTLRLEWDPEYMELISRDVVPDEWYSGRGWETDGMIDEELGFIDFWGAAKETNYFITQDYPWLRPEFHCLQEGTSLITIKSGEPSTIFIRQGPNTVPTEPEDFSIVVHQRPPSVGGFMTSTNKLTVLAPYLSLVGLVAVVASAAVIMKRRKN